MCEKKHLIVWIAVSILLSLVAACGPTSPPPQQATPTLSPGTEQVKGRLTVQDGRIFEYEILLPRSWTGKYEIREEGNVAFFDYNANPQNTLFSIAAFTEAQWQEVQKEPGHGTALLSQDGVVFVYNIALDNPYTGSQAEEFQQMAGQVQSVVGNLTVSTTPTSTDMERAREALEAFFSLLHDQRYGEALQHYGGDYQVLRDWNPDVANDDYAKLFENGCTVNGLQCLTIKTVLEEREVSPEQYTFTIEFAQEDGSLFERGSCCGATKTGTPTVSRFAYTVRKVDGKFLVQELPVYVP